jgi:hypothetical protein
VVSIQKRKSRSISLNADPTGFHVLSGTIPGNHSIPPEGFQCTTFSGSLAINEKTECRRTNIAFLSHTYTTKVNGSNAG